MKPRGASTDRHGFRPVMGFKYSVTHWQAEARKGKIHLGLDLDGRPERYILRFHSPDTLGFLLEELARIGHYVWNDLEAVEPVQPATSAAKRRRPPRRQEMELIVSTGHQPAFDIGTWCRDELAQLPPEQVHLTWHGFLDAPVLIRFVSAAGLTSFIGQMAGLRQAVWPEAEQPKLRGPYPDEPLRPSGYGRG